jgi:hypothetical protein
MNVSATPASTAPSSVPLNGHLWHLVAGLAFFAITIGGIAIAEYLPARRQRPRPTTAPTPTKPWLLLLLAIAGAGAATVHYVVMPDHFEEATLYGAFFAAAATLQLGYSILVLVRPSRALIATGIAGNLAMVALWLVTRVVAIPLGPSAGETEAFGGLDILASSFETLVVITGAVLLLRGRDVVRVGMRALASFNVAGLVAVAGVAVALTAVVSPPS